jgi:tetratricopeptide (TPR) repeat protein
LLGQAYLAAGRFPSAVGALTDALALDPASGAAALHLALAQIATGDWGGARETLGAHEGSIPAADRGLALALAGDPVTAVAVLNAAAREPGADAKTRQNLALSLALAGRWNEAKTVASLDMSPAEVDARIMQWASFAKPTGAADQVAALLGVVPVVDGGQPERLALNTSSPNVAAVAQTVAPVDTYMPGQVAAAADVAVPAPSVGSIDVANIASGVVFAPRREIVQAIPVTSPMRVAMGSVPKVRPAVAAVAVAAPAQVVVRAPAKGNFYVQLGAFESAGVARDAWSRMARRVGPLGSYVPQGTKVSARGQNFYRLSVGGFARGDADTLCRKLRAGGGTCFVRAGAGDQVAAWTPKGVQVAMR